MVAAMRDADAGLPTAGAPAIHRPAAAHHLPLPHVRAMRNPRGSTSLEEAVESFLRQTDVHSELLDPQRPRWPGAGRSSIPACGSSTSRRAFARWAKSTTPWCRSPSGSLLAPWEDDDISLPHRLELSRERLGDRDYFNPRRYWFLDHHGLHWDHAMGVGHNLSLFRRRAWQTVGGYPGRDGLAGRGDGPTARRPPRRPLPGRRGATAGAGMVLPLPMGASPCHLSGQPDMQGLYDSLGAAPAAAGRFTLEPHWREDYSGSVAAARAPWQVESHWPAALTATRQAATVPAVAATAATRRSSAAAAYLSGVGRVEDWGCGMALFQAIRAGGLLLGHRPRPVRLPRPGSPTWPLHLDDRRHLPAARARARPALATHSG